jgi:hypothetical protein
MERKRYFTGLMSGDTRPKSDRMPYRRPQGTPAKQIMPAKPRIGSMRRSDPALSFSSAFLGVDDLIDAACCGDEVKREKPHPDIVRLTAASRLRLARHISETRDHRFRFSESTRSAATAADPR